MIPQKLKEHPHFIHLSKHAIAYTLGVVFLSLTYFYFCNIHADEISRNLQMAALVVPNCIIESSPSQINFGIFKTPSFGPSESHEATTAFSVRCSKGVTSTFSINRGENSISGHRNMINSAGNYLMYELYTGSNKAVAWNEITAVSYQWESSIPYSVIIYAYLPSGQYVKTGAYHERFVVTIRFYPYAVIQTFSVLVTIVFLPKDVLDVQHLSLHQ